MRFPYGISDFAQVIGENYFYVDRTNRIPVLENVGKQLLFLRPRRFGKSLLLSMLENYYDVAKADEFERLFGHLAIGRHPTPQHNQYFILKWDFSAVVTQGDVNQVVQALHNHVNGTIELFAARYADWLAHPIQFNPQDALRSFQSLLAAIQRAPYPLYLLIDEYDNFANEALMSQQPGGEINYKALLYGEGILKTLFKAVKSASSGLGLERVFIAGVSPVVLSDMTSGYNVARGIYLDPRFNDLCGFKADEVARAVEQIVQDCDYPVAKVEEAVALMRTFYNGYRFSLDASDLVYNPTLALYFLQAFQEACAYPRELLDSNLAMDRGKLTYISRLPGGGQVLLDAVNEAPPLAVQSLADRFGVEDVLAARKDTTFQASLLYYFGILTLGDINPFGELTLRIPNLVVRRLYVEQIQALLLPDTADEQSGQQAARMLFQQGYLQPLCDFVEQRYFPIFANRDYRWANELTVKTAFLTLLFNDTFYIMASEATLARGYANLTMIVRPEMRQYQLVDILIEFKYLALSELGLNGEQARALTEVEMRALPVVQTALTTALSQLQSYQQTVTPRLGPGRQARAFAVVSLGFERLLWNELPAG